MNKERGRAWPWWAEALMTCVVGAAAVQQAYVGAGGTLLSPRVGLAVALTLPVLLRRRKPVLAVVSTTVGAVLLGSFFPLLVVVFHRASRGRFVFEGLCVVAAMVGSSLAHPGNSLWLTRKYGPLAVLLLAVVIGLWAGNRRRHVAALAEQVNRLQVERELRSEQVRLEERTRIAAEMHDVLAHRLTVIALHTGALKRRAADLPEPVATRIGLLRTASTDALGDLRDVLGVLHGHDSGERPASRAPGLPALSTVIDEARAAGQQIEAVVEGRPDSVPASHRLAIHRLAQEALTNARKHAAGATAHLEVRYGPPQSTVVIRNPAGVSSEAATEGSGYGLVGLAERVAALNGRLEYGPTGSGGWRVAATIPLDDLRSRGVA
ncbi:sensor histidine kinase [Streptomyces lydicus]|uniref:sensor histidine kinase n=1 Tax=Streptomyces lydicus TaxID=47763 RepID=UPI001F5134F2|nr:histidine kinase [Streptomyces lydicus]MCZ1008371.1 histidine kinase [Streptomyces lydicus]